MFFNNKRAKFFRDKYAPRTWPPFRTLPLQHDCLDGHDFFSDLDPMNSSRILAGNKAYLNQMDQWLNGTINKWTLCWRATEHGWDVTAQFHPRCDYKAPTVTIVQVGQYIFGGFADKSWDGMICLCLVKIQDEFTVRPQHGRGGQH